MPALDRHDTVFLLDLSDTGNLGNPENRFHPDWIAEVQDIDGVVPLERGHRDLLGATDR